jgi:general stress protein CsbA
MKKYLLSAVPLLPIVIVVVFAIGGVTMKHWVYVILAVVCLWPPV